MQFNENDKEREQRILHHFIYRGLKDGGGGGGGGVLKLCKPMEK